MSFVTTTLFSEKPFLYDLIHKQNLFGGVQVEKHLFIIFHQGGGLTLMYVGGDQPRPNFDNEVEVQIMPGMWFKVRFVIFFSKK